MLKFDITNKDLMGLKNNVVKKLIVDEEDQNASNENINSPEKIEQL